LLGELSFQRGDSTKLRIDTLSDMCIGVCVNPFSVNYYPPVAFTGRVLFSSAIFIEDTTPVNGPTRLRITLASILLGGMRSGP